MNEGKTVCLLQASFELKIFDIKNLMIEEEIVHKYQYQDVLIVILCDRFLSVVCH